MKNSFKQHILISLGVVLAAIAAASAALYFLSGDIHVQAAKIISDKQLAAQQTAAVSILAHLKTDAARAAQYTVALDKLLPTHDELIGFPQWASSLGQSHHVAVSAVFQGNNTPAGDAAPGSDGFSLSATGAASDILAFLNDFEVQAPDFLLTINSFDLVNRGSNYQLSAQGQVFSR